MLDGGARYLTLSQKCLEDGERHLAEANWAQAPEKLWGAAAQMVEAVAQSRGRVHDSHRELFRSISLLAQEGQDGELGRFFGLAHNLHANFYENWLPPDQAEDGASAVREFVQKLRPKVGTVES